MPNLMEVLGLDIEDLEHFKELLYTTNDTEQWKKELVKDEKMMKALVLMPYITKDKFQISSVIELNAQLILAMYEDLKDAVEYVIRSRDYQVEAKILLLYAIGYLTKTTWR